MGRPGNALRRAASFEIDLEARFTGMQPVKFDVLTQKVVVCSTN
jgi:hypothetical protein